MTNPLAMNSRNKSTPRPARPAAGAASCPAGEAKSKRFRAKTCPGFDPGWVPVRVKKTRQKALAYHRGQRFSCQAGRCPISGAGVSASLSEAPAWSAAIAQLVEHVIRNDGVTGSNPVCGTSKCLILASNPKTRFPLKLLRLYWEAPGKHAVKAKAANAMNAAAHARYLNPRTNHWETYSIRKRPRWRKQPRCEEKWEILMIGSAAHTPQYAADGRAISGVWFAVTIVAL